MRCSFCNHPAASPATGCQYTANTLACAACTREFWAWFRSHQYRGTKASKASGCPTFYESINATPRKIVVA